MGWKFNPLGTVLFGPILGGTKPAKKATDFLRDPLGGMRRREERKQERARAAELGQLGQAEALYATPLFDAEAARRAGESRIGQGYGQAVSGLRGNLASRGLFRSGFGAVNEAGLDLARGASLANLEADIAASRASDEANRRAALAGIYGQRGAILGQPITHPQTSAVAGALGQLAGTALGGMFGGPPGAMAGGQLGGSIFGGGQQQMFTPRATPPNFAYSPNLFGNPYQMPGLGGYRY